MKKAIISGVGPLEGLGAQLCIRFATKGLHVLVAGRTQAKLDSVVAVIEANGGSAEAVVADSTNEAETVALFDRAGADLDVTIYNTGNNSSGHG
jgi:NAD(P)-dependent dehydrogenase (short-subunit alcohol dehydrogenase family)